MCLSARVCLCWCAGAPRPIRRPTYLLEDEFVEVALQLLVAVVDAKLLERVCVEVLEPEDVQDGDPLRR